LIKKRESLETKTLDAAVIDERYHNKILELEEISSMTLEDVDQRAVQQERELERVRETLRSHKKETLSLEQGIKEVEQTHKEKSSILSERESEDRALNEKFQKMFKEREQLQSAIHEKSFELSNSQNEWRQIESLINDLKIGNAKLSAEREALEMESTEFIGVEKIQASPSVLDERLQKAQQQLSSIGSINLRALEVYEGVKKEYDSVQEKVTILDKEKQEIMNIIAEIDNKKKRTFMKTFNGINDLFTSNFSRLSSKGQAFLEIENQENMFDGGVTMVVKFMYTYESFYIFAMLSSRGWCAWQRCKRTRTCT
jgi:chromosome segregation protein